MSTLTPRRRSRRLSGDTPDLTLEEADKALTAAKTTPVKNTRRRSTAIGLHLMDAIPEEAKAAKLASPKANSTASPKATSIASPKATPRVTPKAKAINEGLTKSANATPNARKRRVVEVLTEEPSSENVPDAEPSSENVPDGEPSLNRNTSNEVEIIEGDKRAGTVKSSDEPPSKKFTSPLKESNSSEKNDTGKSVQAAAPASGDENAATKPTSFTFVRAHRIDWKPVIKSSVVEVSLERTSNKSGRFWKDKKDSFRSTKQSKGMKMSLKQRMELKEGRKRAKQIELAMKEEVQREKEEKRRRTEENKKRKEENAKKSEVVAVIKNPAKLKRIKKKQLRLMAKRDLTKVDKS